MSVKKENGTFVSSEKNTVIVYTRWYDDTASPKALLVIAHGMSEYIDRYDNFARFMVANGYAVYGNDHLGHGKTVVKLEDRGYFAESDGRLHVMNDMRTLCGIAKKNFPGVKVVLMGHSMGSFIARLFCMNYSKEIDAAIFMGTSGKNPLSALALFLANVIARFKGEKHISPFYTKLVSGTNNQAYKNSKTGFDWLNTDEGEIKKYMSDELCGFPFTISGYRELAKMLIDINEPCWAANIKADLPVLVISGEGDPVGAFGKGVRETCQGLQDAGITDVTLKLYPGLRHEILNEPDKAQVYKDLLVWCDSKTVTG
ncbi:MAG: lysophospholipase [Treponema sp.]|jgi:alpha-beta hydrolase superfamily lysophospholipase|nr:lysophospholipase [Treponema sp.]